MLDAAGSGVACVAPNAAALGDALSRVVADPPDVAHGDALERFGIERTAEAHETLYRTVF